MTLPSFTGQADASAFMGHWVITVTNSGYQNATAEPPEYHGGALYTVDADTDTLYGPFLEDQLGDPSGGLFDVAITPDCSTAIVSNFGNSTIFFVDITDLTNPQLLGSLNVSHFAEDVAITSDGRFALVSDGGFSPRLASVDIATRTLVEVEDMATESAQAVAVAPDGTVIVADYWNCSLHTLTIDASGYLTPALDYYFPLYFKDDANFTEHPINVAVAPDGKTVLVVSSDTDSMPIYRIMAPGTLTYCGRVVGLPPYWNSTEEDWYGGQQSVAFSANGQQAYVLTNGLRDPANISNPLPNQISVFDITGPGSVSLRSSGAATLISNSSSQLFGVDVMDVACGKLYVGNPTLSGGVTYLTVVDLSDFSVYPIPVGAVETAIVTGVAALPRLVVGGDILPINKGELLAPVLGLTAMIVLSIAALSLRGSITKLRPAHSSD